MRLLLVAVALTGCLKQEATFTATVLDANAKGYVIEVKTVPGLKVHVESTEVESDATGLAHFEIPLKAIDYMKTSSSMHVRVDGRKLLTKYFGNGEVKLPFTPQDAATIPSGSDWLRVLSGGRDVVTGEFATVWSFGKEGGALVKKDGSLSLEVLGPRNASVAFEGHSAKTDAMGRATVAFSTDDVLALIPVSAIKAGYGGTPAPVNVRVQNAPVPLRAMWSQVSGRSFRQRFTELSAKPFGGARGNALLVLYVASDDALHALGPAGHLRDLDVVALATGKPAKKMSQCDGYRLMEKGKPTGEPFSINRDGVDEEIVALDAHTGKELGRKSFSADEEQCPASRWTGSSTFEARPKPSEVTAWLSGL